ncbi:MAG: tRNA uridine-5-carboxymethylaminomethyl(34) synthesis GTPase MnmE [bacterium]
MSTVEDTIAAISTPRGEAALCVVRISGGESFDVLRRVFRRARGKSIETMKPRVTYRGVIVRPRDGVEVDDVQAVRFEGPASYTGEDAVEIYGHGGILVSERVLGAVLDAGARLAERGEFTMRAYLNGKIDLMQAEAVLDVITARNEKFLGMSVRNLQGSLSERMRGEMDRLVSLIAGIEVEIEYPDESYEVVSEVQVKTAAREAKERLEALLRSYGSTRVIREGVKVALVGPPNVGKSSLMNRLLEKDRVIVTPVPGTTRDLVGDWLRMGGMDVLLMDTAGIAETEDVVEREGIRRTREFMNDADLVFFILDASVPMNEGVREALGHVCGMGGVRIVVNKTDLPRALDAMELEKLGAGVVMTSALTGDGVGDLRGIIRERVVERLEVDVEASLANERQKRCVETAVEALDDVLVSEGVPVDVLAIDLRRAASALGDMMGEGVTERVLEDIFTRFCVGK